MKLIRYANAYLEISAFLVDNDLWPFDMPIDSWPTYCGAGEGLGDYIVPDHILGVCIAPACFQHDIEYAVNNRNWLAFVAANRRLRGNIIQLTDAHLSGVEKYEAWVIAEDYFAAVMAFGWPNFTPDATLDTWQQSKIVKEKLHRLAMHNLQYAR